MLARPRESAPGERSLCGALDLVPRYALQSNHRVVAAMNTSKPEPLFAEPIRKMCPICGKRAYSSTGIHPQCAVRQADAPRQAQLAEDKKRERIRLEQENATH
jgi:hypothetical protein